MIQKQEYSSVQTVIEENTIIHCPRTDTLIVTTIHTSMMIQQDIFQQVESTSMQPMHLWMVEEVEQVPIQR